MNEIKEKKQVDMLNGSLFDKMIKFALPLAFSSMLQQLFNAVDVAVAGKYAGKQALAAVGANSALISVFVNLFVGMAIGTNVVIATLVGQNKKKEVPLVVHTSILLAVISGLFLMIVLIPLAVPILSLIGTPPDILEESALYLKIYLIGMPFILLYNYGAAILRSIGDTKRPMIALVIAGVINTLLNLWLVISFNMGVRGVAIATVVSNIISSSIVLIILMRENDIIRVSIKKLKIEPLYLKRIIAVGLPAGFQGMIFSISNVLLQTGINSFGSDATAGSSAGLTYEYLSYYVSNSFAQAAVTFSSQNFGAGNTGRCRKICLIGIIEGVLFTEALSMIFVIFRYPLVGLFSSDAEVIKYAIWRMMRVMALEGLTCIYEVSGGVIRGMGHSAIPAFLTTFGTVVFRVGWILTIFKWDHSFTTLMLVYMASWIFNSIMMLIAYYIIVVRKYRRISTVT